MRTVATLLLVGAAILLLSSCPVARADDGFEAWRNSDKWHEAGDAIYLYCPPLDDILQHNPTEITKPAMKIFIQPPLLYRMSHLKHNWLAICILHSMSHSTNYFPGRLLSCTSGLWLDTKGTALTSRLLPFG